MSIFSRIITEPTRKASALLEQAKTAFNNQCEAVLNLTIRDIVKCIGSITYTTMYAISAFRVITMTTVYSVIVLAKLNNHIKLINYDFNIDFSKLKH